MVVYCLAVKSPHAIANGEIKILSIHHNESKTTVVFPTVLLSDGRCVCISTASILFNMPLLAAAAYKLINVHKY